MVCRCRACSCMASTTGFWMVDAASVAIGAVDKGLATTELARQLAVLDLPTGERAMELTRHCVDLQSGRSAVHFHHLRRLLGTAFRKRRRSIFRLSTSNNNAMGSRSPSLGSSQSSVADMSASS